ncbi:MAG: hypothetical protein V3T72_03905, partial [Thermoanaerobaculia bacterium]
MSNLLTPVDRNRALIITTGAVEFRALSQRLEGVEEKVSPHGTVHEVGTSGSWKVTLLETSASASSVDAIVLDLKFLDPDLVLFVGTASGFRDVAPGDVVAATSFDTYDDDPVLQVDTTPTLDHRLEQRLRA